ncbi:hypothetical protein QBC47DRAFT_4010 [Echria macrotheca]|uniref:Uncharacterized protein n=1 Tax=Echria macrotheca TaxID=438768 RepID=A0AAJ0BQS5_9PEZI|nr:hypothetical protein QBC47DRAFT_4010 [Echria macrotheca]
MSYPTKQIFTHRPQGWDATTLTHPAMAFMHAFTLAWCETRDAHTLPFTTWMTPDFVLVAHDGKVFTGEAAAIAFARSSDLYDSCTVECETCYIEDSTDGGYTGLAGGKMYINFKVAGEKTCKDALGREWELSVPRAYDCTWVRDESGANGLKLSKMVVYGDLRAIAKAAKERKMI